LFARCVRSLSDIISGTWHVVAGEFAVAAAAMRLNYEAKSNEGQLDGRGCDERGATDASNIH